MLFKDLPEWAQKEVMRVKGTLQINTGQGSLIVDSGKRIYFNGLRVYRPGEEPEGGDTEPKVILFYELPEWAQKTIRSTSPGSLVQTSVGGNSLQINSDGIFFNGKKVKR